MVSRGCGSSRGRCESISHDFADLGAAPGLTPRPPPRARAAPGRRRPSHATQAAEDAHARSWSQGYQGRRAGSRLAGDATPTALARRAPPMVYSADIAWTSLLSTSTTPACPGTRVARVAGTHDPPPPTWPDWSDGDGTMAYDPDLTALLKRCNDEELRPLVEYLRRGLHELASDDAYRRNPDRPSRYVPAIVQELQLDGGHTIANMARGGEGVPYREVLCDVCEKFKVPVLATESVDEVELHLLCAIYDQSIASSTAAERVDRIQGESRRGESVAGYALAAGKVLTPAIRLGASLGTATSPGAISAVVAKIVAQRLAVIGVSPAATAGVVVWVPLVRQIAAAGSLVHALSAPATRITVPFVIHVAYLRQLKAVQWRRRAIAWLVAGLLGAAALGLYVWRARH